MAATYLLPALGENKMLIFLAARIERNGLVLINARLDGYPAYFRITPEAIAERLAGVPMGELQPLEILEANWQSLAPDLERLVRKYGQDFLVTPEMLKG
jgi:hypothetical protein